MQKKQFLGLAMALAIGMIPSYPANAYTFRSKGMIDFQNGTESIVFDARDFSTVENNILQGKQNIINALEHIKTYFRADGTSQTGSRPDDPYTGNIGELSFTQIADAIKNSQKIPDLSDRTVTNKNGEPLYYKTEEAKNEKNLIEITNVDPGFPDAGIKGYIPATPDNLTAGTVAWVDGELIIGTGGDNQTFIESGKTESIVSLVNGTLKEYSLDGYNISGTGSRTASKEYTIPIYTLFDDPDTKAILMSITFNQSTGINRGQASISTQLKKEDSTVLLDKSWKNQHNEFISYHIFGNSDLAEEENIYFTSVGSYKNSEYACGASVHDFKLVYIIPE